MLNATGQEGSLLVVIILEKPIFKRKAQGGDAEFGMPPLNPGMGM